MANLRVNGQERAYDGDPLMPLMWYLRDELGLTGTKFGCGVGLCGACTVHVNGEAVRSCMVQMSETAGKTVTTIEGLSQCRAHPVQQAWLAEQVTQCGYCEPGMLIAVAALIRTSPSPSDAELEAIENICRCGIGPRLKKAIARAGRSATLPREQNAADQNLSSRFSNGSSESAQSPSQ